MENKKEPLEKSKNFFPIVLLIIIVLGIIGIVIYNFSKPSITGNVINDYTEEQQRDTNIQQKNCKEVQVPYDYEEEYQDTVPYTDTICETKQLAYSLDNFVINYETCNKYEEKCNSYTLGFCTNKIKYCIDKSISCSIEVRNLDNENPGTWTIRFSFIDSNANKIEDKDVSGYVYAQSTETMTGMIKVVSEREDGNANKDLTCGYSIQNIPTKQVCRDVTKYKEVTRTRMVTRYRTDTKCE